jgi:pyridoxamine 5'-phosphate oxidase family protein
MSRFSDAERRYLTEADVLGRLVTIQPDGELHVVPVGWTYNASQDTIDVTGRAFARTKKFRNVQADARVAFIVDEVLPPWRPRAVMVQGRGEPIERSGADALIRIVPTKVVSWGLG